MDGRTGSSPSMVMKLCDKLKLEEGTDREEEAAVKRRVFSAFIFGIIIESERGTISRDLFQESMYGHGRRRRRRRRLTSVRRIRFLAPNGQDRFSNSKRRMTAAGVAWQRAANRVG